MDTAERRRMTAAIKSALPPAPPGMPRRIEAGLPFSVGPRSYQYQRDGLKMTEGKRSERTERLRAFIEDSAAGRDDGIVPYAFRLRDGSVISMDAGVLGFLSNRTSPEIEFALDPEGWIVGVSPVGSRPSGSQTSYTLEEITTDGLAPAMDAMVLAAQSGAFVTYGDLAAHLDRALGKTGLSPRHMGHVAGALMDRLWTEAPDTPLLNLLVVRGDSSEPGAGATWYLRRRFGLKGPLSDVRRRSYIQEGLNEVWAYGDWTGLRTRVFGAPPVPLDPIPEIEADGQRDNPRFGGGVPESEEHRNLKAYVAANPGALRLGLKQPQTEPERDLPSGDRVDVEIVDGPRRIAVEVKSIRSGDADLVRGVYQCIKYRAVMKAQSGFGDDAECDAILVTERALPPSIAALARRLNIRCRVLSVNV